MVILSSDLVKYKWEDVEFISHCLNVFFIIIQDILENRLHSIRFKRKKRAHAQNTAWILSKKYGRSDSKDVRFFSVKSTTLIYTMTFSFNRIQKRYVRSNFGGGEEPEYKYVPPFILMGKDLTLFVLVFAGAMDDI